MSDFYGDYRGVEVLRQDIQQKNKTIEDLNSRLAEAERQIAYLEGQNEALRLALGRE